jgi:hypothetical protein
MVGASAHVVLDFQNAAEAFCHVPMRRGVNRRDFHPSIWRIQMSKSDFLPSSDVEFAVWHDHFKGAVNSKAADTGLSAAELAQLEADNAELRNRIVAVNLAAAAHKQATAEKKEARSRIEAGVRAMARRIKAQAGYKPALGALFGIEGPVVSSDLSEAKPNLTGTDHTGGSVVLSFNKLQSDGVNLYSQREGDVDWVLLAHVGSSPFTDRRALLQIGKPELRRYSAVYVQKQQEVGQFSDEVVVNCAP